jgi:hypothetical protein
MVTFWLVMTGPPSQAVLGLFLPPGTRAPLFSSELEYLPLAETEPLFPSPGNEKLSVSAQSSLGP